MARPIYVKPRRRLLQNPEDILQASAFRLFSLQFPKLRPLFFSIPNGGRTALTTAKRLKATGLTRGVADTFLAVPNKTRHGLFIEFKTPGNYQTPEQKNFAQLVMGFGYEYVVVKDIDSFQVVVETYLQDRAL